MKTRYRLNIDDDAHLSRVVSLPFSLWWLVPAVLGVVGLAVTLAVAVIMNTSLKNRLPGYMPPQQREATIDDLMRVDSLQRLYEDNQRYLENLMAVVDDKRSGGDSARYAEIAVKTVGDSLMPATKREREFRAMMQERERYNLSVLAPLATDGMVFEQPAPGYTFAHGSENEKLARIIIPKGEVIRNLTRGTVVDMHHSLAGGYSVTIQHNNGILTRWACLGLPLVEEGEQLEAGQAIAPPREGDGRDGAYIMLRMWRNGTPLIPYSILRSDRVLTPDAVVK